MKKRKKKGKKKEREWKREREERERDRHGKIFSISIGPTALYIDYNKLLRIIIV